MPLLGSRGAASLTGFGGLSARLGGYLLRNSLRFRRANSAYLSRTPASAGNRQTWTWSGWVKRGQLEIAHAGLFSALSGSESFDLVYEGNVGATADSLRFVYYNGSALNGNLVTTALYRDPASWYHIVAVWNTTDATSSNRMRLYVNGNEITSFSASGYPTQNTSALINNTVAHTLGRYYDTTSYFDGYLSEVNFIDGQALTPSAFAKTDPVTGQWIPIKYSGTYGTNGFYLPFTNTTSTSTLGNDFSSNGNTWTVNNISLTAGATYDSMTDVPTNTSATTANYCVMNPLDKNAGLTLQNGNLSVFQDGAGDWVSVRGTIGVNFGKWYFEFTPNASPPSNFTMFGIATSTGSLSTNIGASPTGYGYNANDGYLYSNSTGVTYGATFGANDVIGVAIDIDAGKIWFSKNGTYQNSGNPSSGTNAAATNLSTANTYFPAMSSYNGTVTTNCNFGQRPFAYTPPSGFKNLNTFNLP